MSPEPDSPPRAWVLNLDAEHELEAPGPYTPSAHLARIVARQSRRLLGTLVRAGDVLVLPGAPADGLAAGLEGVAWSPTRRAITALKAAGARVSPTPSVEVLRRVNARPFTVDVRGPLAEGAFAKYVALDLSTVLNHIARPADEGWLVRRTFGAAGRGRRRLCAGAPSVEERAWLEAGLRLGPLVVEPWVRVTREFTRSGLVGDDGAVEIAGPCYQTTTEAGSWTATEAATASVVGRETDRRLEAACATAGMALAASGYHGPYGIDAFLYDSSRGETLNPLSEINARYTMDFGIGRGGDWD